MGLILIVVGLGLLALPGAMVRLGRRASPAEWAVLCRMTLSAGATLFELGAVLYAAPTVLRAVGVPALAAMCQRALGRLIPGGSGAGWAAAIVAVTVPLLGSLGWRGARRACRAMRVEPLLGEHRHLTGYELVVLPTDRLLAVSVAGAPGQVLLSNGLITALGTDRTELVVRHEQAHLDLDHERILHLATALEHAFALWWPVRASTTALRSALERSADEVAAGIDPALRRRLQAALLDMSTAAVAPELAAFSAAETVAERIVALDHPPPHPSLSLRCALYLPALSLGGIAAAGLAAWCGEAHALLAMVGHCAP